MLLEDEAFLHGVIDGGGDDRVFRVEPPAVEVVNPIGSGDCLAAGLACALANEALQILVDERLAENSAELGAYFLARLREITSPVVREIRGRGLWIELRPRAM